MSLTSEVRLRRAIPGYQQTGRHERGSLDGERSSEDMLFELRDSVRTCHLAAWALVNDADLWDGVPVEHSSKVHAGIDALQHQLERAADLLEKFRL